MREFTAETKSILGLRAELRTALARVSELKRERDKAVRVRNEATQEVFKWARDYCALEAQLTEARRVIDGSRMTENCIGPLFGSGWNMCIDEILKRFDALAAPPAAEQPGDTERK